MQAPPPIAAVLENVTRIVHQVEEEIRQINRFTAPDFSPFNFINQGEVATTHLLAFFLSPGGKHGQGTLFQELLIARLRALAQVGTRLPAARWHVLAERRFPDVGQIDLLLSAGDGLRFNICIENKPRDQTTDQYQQLTRYRRYLQRQHPEHYLLLYLSRTDRPPHVDSLSAELQVELTKSGHYANITYRDFLLPLLDDWRRAAKPPHLRRFLRQFRHHLEQWLGLPSTKPVSLMKDTAIAMELQASPASIGAAYDIAASLPVLRQNLIGQLTQALTTPAAGLTGSLHWKWPDFRTGVNNHPFLIRRVTGDAPGEPATWPWGRYAITVEFGGGRLFYGIRHDTADWYRGDEEEHPYTPEETQPLAELLGEEVHEDYWWAWWKWANPNDEREFCLSVADGSLIPELQAEILRLAAVLDKFCGVGTSAS